MADRNLLIGIGGTGSKIIEAFMHLCAAGLGPEQVEIGFVEQDSSNGNLSVAKRTLSRYIGLRHVLRGQNSPHAIRNDCAFGLSSLKPLGVDGGGSGDITECVWTPVTAASPSEMFGSKAMDVGPRSLFMSLCDNQEAGLDLGFGFQGHAHVGALAMRNAATGTFWDDITEALKQGEARIFLAGSIFGGTGAAGFPTLARHIRTLAETNKRTGIRISGVLMLPYFSFAPDTDPQSAAVQSTELAEQTKISLKYYARLLGENADRRIFDDLYVVGWHPLFHLPYNQHGKEGQCNPPLVPELLAALAATNVFLTPAEQAAAVPPEDGGTAKPQAGGAGILGCGRCHADTFTWRDLPAAGDHTAVAVRQAIKRWLRFCFAWKYIYRSSLSANALGIPQEQWFKLYANSINFKDANYDLEVTQIDNYVDDALVWAAGMCFASQTSFKLWEAKRFATFVTDAGFPKAMFNKPETVRPEYLDNLIAADESGPRPGTAKDVFELMSSPMPTGNSEGLGKIVDAIFESVAVPTA